MRYWTIFAIFALLCCFIGCAKKQSAPKRRVGGPHSLAVEAPRKVVVNIEFTVTASWKGGTAPFEISWNFPGTLGKLAGRKGTSPDSETFIISAQQGDIGKEYYVVVRIVDADDVLSTLGVQFLLAQDPANFRPNLFRQTSH